ncbi:hypothetical protein AWB76_02355 [Caballeronia temeraria]|uniref:Uncharacterized protein n=1 Tax=Caballeronia temeraria TaxID=1777137 RepID=A0A158AG59_9BURK|nr:hypothetical protein AWB76_02355 [Caballeronia temeraria]
MPERARVATASSPEKLTAKTERPPEKLTEDSRTRLCWLTPQKHY